MVEFLKAILLGIIQGITEWLPIRSTGHLILVDSLWPMEDPAFFEVFKVVIQFGSILAVCVLFFHKLNPFSPKKTVKEKKANFQLWFKVFVGILPAMVIGLLFDDFIEDILSGNLVIACTLILYGVFFIMMEKQKRTPDITRLETLDYRTAFLIGCFQVLALVPGTSRSGATILGGVLLGCSRYVASEFSFFLAIPVMAGASGLKIIKYIKEIGWFTFGQWFLLLVGTFVAFIISLFAIRMLLSYIRKHDFKIFGYYRIILGIVVLLVTLLF